MSSIANLSYKELLNKFDGYLDYLEEIEKVKDKIEWEEAKRINTQRAYEEYLYSYINGIYSFEAKQKIDEFIALKRAKKLERKRKEEERLAKIKAEKDTWKIVCKNNRKKDYENYLKYYPNGIYSYEAKIILEKIQLEEQRRIALEQEENAWKIVSKSENIEDYKRYLEFYPNGIYANKAKSIIRALEKKEEITWRIAYRNNMAEDYLKYINNFPKGKHINKAKIKYKEELENESKIKKIIEWGDKNNIRMYYDNYNTLTDPKIKIDYYSLNKVKNITQLKVDFMICEGKDIKLPSEFTCFKDLKEIEFICIPQYIETLPEWIKEFKNLKLLTFTACYIKTLPDSIKEISTLEEIRFLDSKKKVILPKSIGYLKNLHSIFVGYGVKIFEGIEYPNTIHNLKKLKTVTFTGSKNSLENISKLSYLENLIIYNTKNFDFSNALFLKNLNKVTFNTCYTNSSFLPEWLKECKNLKSLKLLNTDLIIPNWIDKLINLEKLSLQNPKSVILPETIGNLRNLKKLSIGDSPNIQIPKSIINLTYLERLFLYRNYKFNLPDEIMDFHKLKIRLYLPNEIISSCRGYKYISDKMKTFLVNNHLSLYSRSVLEDWEIESIKNKIENYNKALKKADENLWNKLISDYPENYFEVYLDECPVDGIYIEEAKKMQEEYKYWNYILNINTKEAYEDYLKTYPNGIYAEKAKEYIKELSKPLNKIFRKIFK